MEVRVSHSKRCERHGSHVRDLIAPVGQNSCCAPTIPRLKRKHAERKTPRDAGFKGFSPNYAEANELIFFGAGEGNRTPDLRITNAPLYQLSYSGTEPVIVAISSTHHKTNDRSMRLRLNSPRNSLRMWLAPQANQTN